MRGETASIIKISRKHIKMGTICHRGEYDNVRTNGNSACSTIISVIIIHSIVNFMYIEIKVIIVVRIFDSVFACMPTFDIHRRRTADI